MKKVMKQILSGLVTFAMITGIVASSNITSSAAAKTPLAKHGRLSVSGAYIVDCHGKKVQLRGVSLHGIQHTNGGSTAFKDYINKKSFKQIRDKWGVNLVRIPVYTEEGGYCNGNQADMDKSIQKAVKLANELGMYVIIDWHILSDGNPAIHQAEAKKFFKKYAKKYKKYKNVIYEICNEPNGDGVNWQTVKQYAVDIIPAIRKYDKKALIVVGTPQWSQLVDEASYNPITVDDYKHNGNHKKAPNVLYTIHFYAATHYDDIMNKVTTAHNNGLPIFCTEFSISDASGNGNIDQANADRWMSLLKKYKISYACWSLSNCNESSAIFNSWSTKVNGWKNADISTTGHWFINKYKKKN